MLHLITNPVEGIRCCCEVSGAAEGQSVSQRTAELQNLPNPNTLLK